MNTPPADLPTPALRAAVASGWSLDVESLDYRAVGFGSHHWELADSTGARWFVTVDDLRTARVTRGEPLTACFDRLRAALTVAHALRAAGRDFVLAPIPGTNGELVAPLGESFAVAVYPYVTGEEFTWGDYTPAHRDATLRLVTAVHTAPAAVRDLALREDYSFPWREAVTEALDGADSGDSGPFAAPAGALLTTHAPRVRAALARYDSLVSAALADSPALVLTHGEPHPGNTMRTDGTWLLIDWDTALAAPPERDLWHLDSPDGSVLAAYTAATGTVPRPDLLDLYRLRWDLTEIGVYLARFREPHGRTTDDQESWANLEEAVTHIAA